MENLNTRHAFERVSRPPAQPLSDHDNGSEEGQAALPSPSGPDPWTEEWLFNDFSDSVWQTGSDPETESDFSAPAARHHEEHPGIVRPSNVPPKTEEWVVVPKSRFATPYDLCGIGESDPDLCAACSSIDFEAIFQLNAEDVGGTGAKVGSFSGLSRSMLKSPCHCCRLFATMTYSKFDENTSDIVGGNHHTFEGHLVAFASGVLCGYPIESDYETGQSIVLRLHLLMSPLPFKERPCESFSYVRPFGSDPPRWEYVCPRGILLQNIMDEGSDPDRRDQCHGILIGEGVDYKRLLEMIHQCEQKHTRCREKRKLARPFNARVIDCRERNVVSLADDLEYIALSYVWGKHIEGITAGVHETIPATSMLPSALPSVIEDAIKVTLGLGHRYLWVDYLCIHQCHSADKVHQIRQMANIYSNAYACICSSGSDSNIGLYGVSMYRRPSLSARIGGITYMHANEPDSIVQSLQNTPWTSRAWTFQEALLSKRCLIFTNEQVSLLCQSSNQVETISRTSEKHDGSVKNIYTALLGVSTEDLSFDLFISHYQRRMLSYERDALDAFKGLLSLAPTKSYFGILLPIILPKREQSICAAFAHGLLWIVCPSSESQTVRQGFPTWSWLCRKHAAIDCGFTHESLRGYGYDDEDYEDGHNSGNRSDDIYEDGDDDYSDRAVEANLGLKMFAPFPENSFFTDIWTETTGGKHISIKDLFKIYDDVQLVPEQSRYLNLRSFSTTYHIVNKIYSPTAGRHYCDVAVDDSDHLPFIFSELDRPYYPGFLHFGPQGDGHSDNMKAKLLFDDDASAVEQNNSEVHRAVLILENADRHVSYWLAYGPLSYIDGKECVHREGIIAVKGKLQWKENWESIPRQSVWLA